MYDVYEKLRQEIKLTAILVYSRIGQLHEIGQVDRL